MLLYGCSWGPWDSVANLGVQPVEDGMPESLQAVCTFSIVAENKKWWNVICEVVFVSRSVVIEWALTPFTR